MARIQSDIVVVALVDAEGRVIGVPIAPTGHPLLAKAAEENIKTWRFQAPRKK
jgi:outer membrane biosynthesis protein TonB